MSLRILIQLIFCLCVASNCTNPAHNPSAVRDTVQPASNIKPSIGAKSDVGGETSKRMSWTDPSTNIEYVFIGLGDFDAWAKECQKIGPKMKPLIIDVNFSKAAAKEILASSIGAAFNFEEVKGREIVTGRVVAYKLPDLQDAPCASYPKGDGGGRLPAFFVPESALQHKLTEKDLLIRSYSCKATSRAHFPVPMVCATP